MLKACILLALSCIAFAEPPGPSNQYLPVPQNGYNYPRPQQPFPPAPQPPGPPRPPSPPARPPAPPAPRPPVYVPPPAPPAPRPPAPPAPRPPTYVPPPAPPAPRPPPNYGPPSGPSPPAPRPPTYVPPPPAPRPPPNYGPPSGPNPPGPRPSYGPPVQSDDPSAPGHVHIPGTPYDFNYAVKDDYYGTDYSHNAVSDGDQVKGEYKVQLPDGRLQIVTYVADWKTGFHPTIQYQGEPRYPAAQPKGPTGSGPY